MSDIIQLLPEAISNQIAAGEVIQRPSSVVKELLENAIDAGSSSISLVIKNSGKSLIQVIDNGKGMSETDARMSFERHATSKIRTSDDLFSINTMGFRGEALASMASIAEIEMKTRQADTDVGTRIVIKSSTVVTQEFCQTEPGTTISVKNLFFNVPARRKFLKSDSVELKHIMDEFKKIALSHPNIRMRLINNGTEAYNLTEGTLKKRVIAIYRKSYESNLVPITEDTDVVKINGFVGNPEIARKQSGEQHIFVNKRYIKSYYLNHAIKSAYDTMLGDDQHPFFVLFLDLDPNAIDINVHPSKQEIKFDDERLVYNFLKVGVKHGLGKFSLTPQLDFENADLNIRTQRVSIPGRDHMTQDRPLASRLRSAPVMRNWQSLYNEVDKNNGAEHPVSQQDIIIQSKASGDLLSDADSLDRDTKPLLQIHKNYIVVQIKSGFMIVNQHSAHRRVLYDKYFKALESTQQLTQKQLFPLSIQVSKDKLDLVTGLTTELKALGFDIQPFGGDTFVLHGLPVGLEEQNMQHLVDNLIDQYASNLKLDLDKNENLARSMAASAAIKKNTKLNEEEMRLLIDELFACSNPITDPFGVKCFITYSLDNLEKMF